MVESHCRKKVIIRSVLWIEAEFVTQTMCYSLQARKKNLGLLRTAHEEEKKKVNFLIVSQSPYEIWVNHLTSDY